MPLKKVIAMKFRESLARLLYGRYGADELYNALFFAEIILLFIGAVLTVLGKVAPLFSVISILCYIAATGLLVWALFRFFSRDVQKRRQENQAWLSFKKRILPKKKPKLPTDTATHVFRACPKCRSTLRLPRQTGKHTAKCPRCSHTFGVKVK